MLALLRCRPVSERRVPGRDTDEQILTAALDLLRERGFGRMSVQAITDRTGIAKTTIYRRYPNKVSLATAAISHLRAHEPPLDTGSCREDLRSFLEDMRERFDLALAGTLLAEEETSRALLHAFREQVLEPRLATLRAALERGVARGEVRADLDLLCACHAVLGSFFAHGLHRGRPDARWPDRMLDALWPGLAAPA